MLKFSWRKQCSAVKFIPVNHVNQFEGEGNPDKCVYPLLFPLSINSNDLLNLCLLPQLELQMRAFNYSYPILFPTILIFKFIPCNYFYLTVQSTNFRLATPPVVWPRPLEKFLRPPLKCYPLKRHTFRSQLISSRVAHGTSSKLLLVLCVQLRKDEISFFSYFTFYRIGAVNH